eukprot:TRINITY_DN8163_c0_g1_i1.p1 TRINITY_DN8163_c0_g1~~TRINITY_DN8163_c0_g1_i1.p1  ORF type:complete len:581 (-),score=149.62 TRINITY_DN8163_c0_g1_i1:117-1859(-)
MQEEAPSGNDHIQNIVPVRPANVQDRGEQGLLQKISADPHAEQEPPASNLFGDISDLKKIDETHLDEVQKDALELQRKYSDSIFGNIAKHKYFEVSTICMIILNALQIGADIDYSARNEVPSNLYQGPIFFIVTENIFAVYFTVEITIRFLAYRKKLWCLRDRWFVFDASLVAMMVWETWVMPFIGGSNGMGQLSVLRLLRLLRITRIAKLMRAFPQLLMIVKGVTAATRAVAWTAILLVMITFTWSIIFTNEYHQGHITDEEIAALPDDDQGKIHELFGNMGKSMLTLLIMGTILDDVTLCSDTVRNQNNMWMLAAFILYILLNSFMMLNMLVGILVEVVGSTAEAETARVAQEQAREAIMTIFTQMDSDGSGLITKEEFADMKLDSKVMAALQDLGIKEKQFDTYVQLLFQPPAGPSGESSPAGVGAMPEGHEAQSMSFEALLEAICRLRPGAAVNLLDWSTFKTAVLKSDDELKERMRRLEEIVFRGAHSRPSTGAVDGEPNKVNNPPKESKKAKWKINFQMMAQLERTPSSEIILELQRRQGIHEIDEIPVSMMDQELYEHVSKLNGWPADGPPLM